MWWIVWGGVLAYALISLGTEQRTALIDAAVTQFIFAVAGYTINTAMHSYQPSIRNSFYVLGWSVALSVLCVFTEKWVLQQLISGQPSYFDLLDRSLLLRGIFGWLMITLIAVLTWFQVYVGERQESEKRKEEATQLAREAELTNLRQQLQPHFLFNSLNSISALIGSRPEEARKMIQQLSDFLRGTVKKDDRPLVTLEEELNHLQLYLDIEKVRFGHRLKTDIRVSEGSTSLRLPSLLLQPVMENAIKFGLYDTTGEITITLSTKVEGNTLIIEVTNPFDASTASARPGTGFGLTSVQRRLYLLFFRNDLLVTSSHENVFITTIKIPQVL